MKLTNLAVHGFIGIKSVEVKMGSPVQLFCGANFAGKSSIRDAVVLALTGNLGRVSLKKDAAMLVKDAAKAAACEVTEKSNDQGSTWDERVYGVTITAAGKIHESREAEVDQTLQYVLDAQSFARLEPKDRRPFLFALMRVRMTPASIIEKMIERGCVKEKVEIVAPLLRSGFEAAHADAKERGTQSKGSWRVTTGETYGAVKAETWKAAEPAAIPESKDQQLLVVSEQQLNTIDGLVAQQNQQIGALMQRRSDLFAKQSKLPELKLQAANAQRLKDKLAVDQDGLQKMQEKVDAAKGAPKPVHALACPCCAALLVMSGGALVEHKPTEAAETTSIDLAAYESSLRLMKSAVANTQRDLGVAESAQRQVDEIAATPALSKDEEDLLLGAEVKIAELNAKKTDIQGRLDRLKKHQDDVVAAAKKTAEAAEHQKSVMEWDKVATLLSSDGLPSEILAAALAPINSRMVQSAADTEWPAVTIEGDMGVRAGGRPYGLLSKSEQWRVDAVIAEAISYISGRKLLVLDEMDILDLSSRGQLLGWLDTLASMGEIDTAMVFATLKQKPSGLPDTITAHWIVDGEIVVEEIAKAA